MKVLALCMVAVMVATAAAEPPSGYNYARPSVGIGGIGGIGGGGGGGYIQVSSGGYTSNEGQNVDSELLNKIRQILLREEANAASRGGSIGGGISSSYGAPSSQYGVPSTQYGVPGYVSRVVGIDLEGIRQAIQVAQYEQTSYGSVGGYPSGPSTSYGAPSSSYGAPSY